MPSRSAAAEMIMQPEFAFGVIADVQYCDGDDRGTRYYRASLKKLAAAVQDFNATSLAFVIQLGDLIDRDFVGFDPVLAVYQQFHAPQYHVLGNHDFIVNPAEKGQILTKLDLTTGYYDFTYHSWRFIVLDGNDLSFYALAPASAKYPAAEAMYQQCQQAGLPNAQTWNGGLGAEQMAWLRQTLAQAEAKGEKVILFCHFPALPRPDQHNLWNDQEVLDLLASYPGVVAYINGHNHAGNYAVRNGAHYLTLPAMVETSDENAYFRIEVYADQLKVIRQGQPAQLLRLK